MADTNFTAEQQSAIDTYNQQKQAWTEKWIWNSQLNTAALNQLKQAWVGMNANWFFVMNTPTQQTTQQTPTQQTPTQQQTQQTTYTGNGRPDQQGALVPETYNYYANESDEAQNKIINNLNQYWQNTPQLFTNYDNFKKNFSYDARTDVQKQTLDNWWFGYETARDLGSKSINDLTTLYKAWQISEADLNNLRAFYPDKYNQVIWERDKENQMTQYQNMLYGTDWKSDEDIMWDIKEQFLQSILSNRSSSAINFYEEYEAEVNTDEMKGWNDRLIDLQTEIDKIDSDLNSLYKDIEKRYEGRGASKAKIQAIYADEAYDLQIQRNSLALEQQSLATKYNSRLQQAQQNFNMKVQEYQLEMQEKNQFMNELWFAMDLINFETNEEADERAWKNWTRQIDYQYGNIDSTDPVARRKAVENSVNEILNQYDWIPMIRSKDQMIDDVLNLVNWGMSLWDALTQNIIKPIQQKPEYVIWKNNKLGTNSVVSYSLDASWNPVITWWSVTKQTGDYTFSTIDNGNGTAVSVWQTLTINWQTYRVTQLWWSRTWWIDFAPAKSGDHQAVQAFVGWKVIRSWTDSNTGNRYVEILWDNGYVYRYNHLNDWDTDYASWANGSPYNGQRVEAWTVIWHMWATWKATGVHLDLAVYDWSRANSTAVSPLDIRDQSRVFFNSVQTSWLWIGSTSTNTTTGLNWNIESVAQAVISQWGESASYWKSDTWKATEKWIRDMAAQWYTWDEILDTRRVLAEDPVWQQNTEAYMAMEKIFTKEYKSNQEKADNFKDLLEMSLNDWDYAWFMEDLLSESSILLNNKSMKDNIDSYKTTIQELSNIQNLYQDYIDAGWKGWVVSWTWNNLQYKFLKTSWNAKLREIQTKLDVAMQNFIKWMSWLTVSDKERQIYEKVFPNTKLSSEAFMNQIDTLMSQFNNWLNTSYWAALWTKRYQDLQDWYKNITWKYYDPTYYLSQWIYQSSSSSRIEIPSSTKNYNLTGDMAYVLYGNNY